MNTSQVDIRRRLRRLSASVPRSRSIVLAAFVTLVAAIGMNAWVVPRYEGALVEARHAADDARRADRRRLVAVSNKPLDPDTTIKQWLAGLPPSAQRQPRVAALLALANAHGLQPLQTELRYEADPVLGVARYRVVFPVTGRYGDIHRFAAAALASDPALLLDRLGLSRSSVQSADVRAEFAFSLLMRSESAEGEFRPGPSAAGPTRS